METTETSAAPRSAETAAPASGGPRTVPAAGDVSETAAPEGGGRPTLDQLLRQEDYRRAFDERLRAAVSRRLRTVETQRAQMRELAGEMARCLGLPAGPGGEVELAALRAALAARNGAAPTGDGAMPPQAPQSPPENAAGELAPEEEGAGADGGGQEPRPQGAEEEDFDDEAARGAFRRLLAEGEALGALYPGFDLTAELADPRFAAVLSALCHSGAPGPVRMAYEALHHERIVEEVARRAVERTAAQVAEGVRSGALRPAENGGGTAAALRTDPRALSPEARRDIRDRVMRGERIVFG